MITWTRARCWIRKLVHSFRHLVSRLSAEEINAPLFETLMMLIVIVTPALYFRSTFAPHDLRTRSSARRVAVAGREPGDGLPMFAYGPMKMPASVYYSHIGLDYLTFPVFGFFASRWHAHETVDRTGLLRAHRTGTRIYPAPSG